MAKWIIGDLRTGRRLVDLPVTSGSWNTNIFEPDSVDCTLDLRDSDLRTLSLRQSTAPAKNFLGVVEGDKILACGPIWTRKYSRDNGLLRITAKGIESIFDHRTILPSLAAEYDVTKWIIPDPATPSKTMPNPALRTLFTDISLGSIAARLVEQALAWTNGYLPISTPANVIDTDPNHRRTYQGTELKNLGDALRQLTGVEDGPEIRFAPRYSPDKLGVVWDMLVGDPTTTMITSTSEPRWDLSAQKSSAYGLEIDENGTSMGSLGWFTGGRSEDTYLLERAFNDFLVKNGYPLMEMVDSSHTSVSRRDTAQSYAKKMVKSGLSPVETWSLKVKAYPIDEDEDELVRTGPWIDSYNVGDFARIKIDPYSPGVDRGLPDEDEGDDSPEQGDWYLQDGINTRHRILGMSGTHMSEDISLKFVPEISK